MNTYSNHIQLTRYAARCLFLWPHIQKQQEEHALAVAISRRGRPKLSLSTLNLLSTFDYNSMKPTAAVVATIFPAADR
jgi:hypothetical protein